MFRSPLFAQLQAAHAQFMDYHGWEIPASFSSVEAEYWALKEAAGVVDLSYRSRLLVRGPDAPRFLHGMVTNEIQQLPVDSGTYTFLLNTQGHILAVARIFRLSGQSFMVDCEPQCRDAIWNALQKHIIADDVELEDRTEAIACLGIEGPCAREVLREAVGFDPPHMRLLDYLELADETTRLAHASLSVEEGFWIWVPPDRIAELWQRALESASRIGGRPVGLAAREICRIEAGVPRYGVDMDDKTLPQETGQIHAISFTKGCYIGQEVVERIRSRGHVNRKLVGLLLEGKQDISPGAPVSAAGQQVGAVTSVTYSFGLRRTIALAYVRQEHAQAGKSVAVGAAPAEIVPLPFFMTWWGPTPGSPSA